MAGFTDHLDHAKSNLKFLEELDKSVGGFWNWKITVSYYTALHLINAFVADKCNLHPDTHQKLKEITCPQSSFVGTRLDVITYGNYNLLEMLSRRARYLCDVNSNDRTKAQLCSGKHFTTAIKKLNYIMLTFNKMYNCNFEKMRIHSDHIEKADELRFFEVLFSEATSKVDPILEAKTVDIKDLEGT